MVACRRGASSGVTSRAPIEKRAILSEVKYWTANSDRGDHRHRDRPGAGGDQHARPAPRRPGRAGTASAASGPGGRCHVRRCAGLAISSEMLADRLSKPQRELMKFRGQAAAFRYGATRIRSRCARRGHTSPVSAPLARCSPAAAVLFVVASAVVAFNGWPQDRRQAGHPSRSGSTPPRPRRVAGRSSPGAAARGCIDRRRTGRPARVAPSRAGARPAPRPPARRRPRDRRRDPGERRTGRERLRRGPAPAPVRPGGSGAARPAPPPPRQRRLRIGRRGRRHGRRRGRQRRRRQGRHGDRARHARDPSGQRHRAQPRSSVGPVVKKVTRDRRRRCLRRRRRRLGGRRRGRRHRQRGLRRIGGTVSKVGGALAGDGGAGRAQRPLQEAQADRLQLLVVLDRAVVAAGDLDQAAAGGVARAGQLARVLDRDLLVALGVQQQQRASRARRPWLADRARSSSVEQLGAVGREAKRVALEPAAQPGRARRADRHDGAAPATGCAARMAR